MTSPGCSEARAEPGVGSNKEKRPGGAQEGDFTLESILQTTGINRDFALLRPSGALLFISPYPGFRSCLATPGARHPSPSGAK